MKIPAMDELQLVENLKLGNQFAYRVLVDKYQRPIRNLCMGMVLDEVIAEELAQDVFIEVFKSIHNFRQDSKLSTWMYRMAVNKSLNYIRSQKKHKVLRSIESFMFDEDNKSYFQIEDKKNQNPLSQIIRSEEELKVNKTLNSLPENQRIAFTLHKFDDFSYKEIADIMNLSLSSVESLIHRAKTNLRKRFLS